jgi:hypothetical protein
MKARDPYPWMSAEEAVDRLRGWLDSMEEAADHSENHEWFMGLRGGGTLFKPDKFTQDSAFSHAADVVAMTKAIYALKAQGAPDPMSEALNSGDGSYRP